MVGTAARREICRVIRRVRCGSCLGGCLGLPRDGHGILRIKSEGKGLSISVVPSWIQRLPLLALGVLCRGRPFCLKVAVDMVFLFVFRKVE